MTTTYGTEVHRGDGELVGFVCDDPGGGWLMRTVFGGELGTRATREEAVAHLEAHGLAVLAETWWYEGEQAHIVEAAPGRVTVAVGPPWAQPRTVALTDVDGLSRRRP